MVKTSTWHAILLAIIIPSSLFLFLVILIRSDYYGVHHVSLRVPIVLDFVITAPFIYFLFIRKKAIPRYTVASVLIIGVIIASIYLPLEDQDLLIQIRKWVVPILEIGILSLVGWKIFNLIRQSKKSRFTHSDFYDSILHASQQVFPGTPGLVLASEISMMYYLICGWKPKILRANEFSYHKKSGSGIIYGTLLFVFAIEAWVVHFMVMRWNPIVAWILTGITVYGILQFLALLASLKQRPIILDAPEKTLKVNYGFMLSVNIPLASIESIEKTSRTPRDPKGFLKTFPLESHNVIIHFKDEITFHMMYGRKKEAQCIGLFLDERELFVNHISRFVATSEK